MNQTNASGFAYAGFGARFYSRFIDLIIIRLVQWIVLLPITVMVISAGGERETLALKLNIATELIGAIYEISLTAFRGQTLGKMILGLKIIKADASPIGIETAAFRYLVLRLPLAVAVFGVADAAHFPWLRAAPCLLLVSYSAWSIYRTSAKTGLHDIFANTIVVRLKDGQVYRVAVLPPAAGVLLPAAVLKLREHNDLLRSRLQAGEDPAVIAAQVAPAIGIEVEQARLYLAELAGRPPA